MFTKLVDDGHGDVTYRIIGVCMAVHNDLGPGHREDAYQRALAQKLLEAGLSAEQEPPLALDDEAGNALIVYRPDFRIGRCVWLEIKAQTHQLTGDDEAQVIDYFAADVERSCDVALLVNFGRPRLEWKRLFAPKQVAAHLRKRWGRQRKGDA